MTGVLSIFMQEPQFQGQTKDRLNNPEMLSAVDGMVRPALEHWLNHNQSIAEVDRRAHHPGGARARGQPRGAAGSRAQGPDVGPRHAARQALRLHAPRLDHQRALHRRRRLGRRVGEAGTRSRAPGDSAAARQGDEHRGHDDRQGAREQGAGGSGDRARLRRRQELRRRRGFATARSSSSPTPIPTAITSRRCC